MVGQCNNWQTARQLKLRSMFCAIKHAFQCKERQRAAKKNIFAFFLDLYVEQFTSTDLPPE